MNFNQANQILGLNGTENLSEIKKRYRKLMHQYHPDTGNEDSNYASDINSAYEFLIKHEIDEKKREKSRKEYSKKNWSAKENINAYIERPIFHIVEDAEGNKIGMIEVTRGKYYWTIEEEFSLFLKSIYVTAKEVLEETDIKNKTEHEDIIKQNYMAELVYLLAGQYIETTDSLNALLKKEADIYKISAMVELIPGGKINGKGEQLFPAFVTKHKLYLKNKTGETIGYLSFKDDRLYYVLIPMFEMKLVLLKMTVISVGKYINLDLQIKVDKNKNITAIDNINLKIEALIKKYIQA